MNNFRISGSVPTTDKQINVLQSNGLKVLRYTRNTLGDVQAQLASPVDACEGCTMMAKKDVWIIFSNIEIIVNL